MAQAPEPQLLEFVEPINTLVALAVASVQSGRAQEAGPELQAQARALVQQIGRSIANGYERGVQEGIRLAKADGGETTEGG